MLQPTNLKVEEQGCSRRGSIAGNLEERIYQKDDLVWVISSRLVTEKRMACCISLVDKESSQEEEMKMTVISHSRGFRGNL